MQAGTLTAESLTSAYLARIEAMDRKGPALHSMIELNGEALRIAAALDAERKAKGARGPLHGIPMVLKDNIDTHDTLTTTAGSLALEGSIAPRDSSVAARLRAAGVVFLGKANMSEWANIRSSQSTSGWSARGGQCKNPYDPARNPCGSSSGTGAAVGANLALCGIGTETDGSVVCPSNANALVGIKPTVGLVSRAGIIPISHTQDTAGPMTRTVHDAALLLSVLAGADPRDAATAAAQGHAAADYTKFLVPDGLKGARIGVARQFLGFNREVDRLFEEALGALKKAGAVLVDPAEIAHTSEYGETEVLLYELKADLAAYLATLGPGARVKSLEDVIDFNEANKDKEMSCFGQETFLDAQKKGPLTDKVYLDALAKNTPPVARRGPRPLSRQGQARRDRRAHRRAGLAHRLHRGRSLRRWQLEPGGGGGLPEHHRAVRLRRGPADRHLVHGPRLERAGAAADRVRLRAGDPVAQAAFSSRVRPLA